MSAVGELPHQRYVEAVARADGPTSPYVPHEWSTRQGPDGLLSATLRYTTAWPHGLEFWWDQREGWRYVWMIADGRNVVHGPEPLPVPILASPAAVIGVMSVLLADPDYQLPIQYELWEHATDLATALGLDLTADLSRLARFTD
ncbi:hypothetical protein [Streptomyces sp. CBMA123]|uniref:hypothetical protein n=1 Tax=Streptomyces sp. CBMA123 TaxID=1896313 RepID=UPI0016618B83|nr:hypothetical protein [Streptomyces sp. CBMA123]MBD0691073.1 hypothetical protein [Streptomyces sp. CBMA123]